MGKIYISSGGGGTDLDVVTAAAGDILAGKVIVGPDGEPLTGTLPNRGQAQNAGGWGTGGSGSDAYFAMNKIPEGAYFSNGADWAPEVRMKQSDVRSVIGATNAANWRSNTTIAGLKGTMPEQGGKTVTPKSSNQTAVSANRYVTGNIIVAGDSNLNAANIKKGVRIFGIIGTFEGYIAGPADLYNKGNNAKGITGEGTLTWGTANFIWDNQSPGGSGVSMREIWSTKPINTTGYTKLNVRVDSWKLFRDTDITMYITSAAGGGTNYAYGDVDFGRYEGTNKTLSFSFGSVFQGNVYIKLNAFNSYGSQSMTISRISLS